MPDKIVIGAALPGAPYERLRGRSALVLPENGVVMDAAEIERALPGAVAFVPLLTQAVTGALLDRHPTLRLVSNVAVGLDNVDISAATARRVLVTHTPDVLTEATADLAFTLLLACAREVIPNDRYLRAGRFTGWLPGALLGADVHGQTLGIVGCGRIGQAVARRARGFEMRLVYTQPERLPAPRETALGLDYLDLDGLCAASDFVSLHCPLTPETHHLFDGQRLARLKRTAILVNTARGKVVDEAALAAALAAGTLAAAGLDVYEHEPAVHPALLELPNAVLLPHVGSATHRTRRAMAELAVAAVEDFLAGRRPRHVANPEVLP